MYISVFMKMCALHKCLENGNIVLYLTSKTSGTEFFFFDCAWESIRAIVGVEGNFFRKWKAYCRLSSRGAFVELTSDLNNTVSIKCYKDYNQIRI